MAVYARLEWIDKGAIFELLNNNIVQTGNTVSNRYAINLDSGKFIYKVAIKDNFTDQLSTRFEPASSRFGSMAEAGIDAVTKFASATGKLSGLAVYFDLLTWEKTEHYKFNIEVMFFPANNTFMDVIVPMKSIQSLSILTDNGDGTFNTPGINFSNISDVLKKAKSNDNLASTRENVDNIKNVLEGLGKFMSIKIPGRVNLDIVLVETVSAEYSSETANDLSPLWGKLDISCVTLLPANDKMIVAPLQDIFARKRANDERLANDKTFAQIIKKRTPVGDIINTFN